MNKIAFASIVVLFVVWIAASNRLKLYLNLAIPQRASTKTVDTPANTLTNFVNEVMR